MARWLGLDISSTSVRLALLRTSYRRVEIEALREERLADHETPSAALRAVTAGLRADATATVLDGLRGFVRFVALPAAAQKELANVLGFEVESTLPLELDDAVMDHRILKVVAGLDAPGTVPILAGVAYTEEVQDRIGLVLRGTGQEPQRVGIGPLPLVNLVSVIPELGRSEPVALLDLEEEHTDVLVQRGGEPRFVRSLMRGTRGLPQEAPLLVGEIRQTLAAWRMQGGEKIDTVYVVGSGRATPGLEPYFDSELELRVLDLPKPNLEGLTAELAPQLPKYAKAIALALGLGRRAADVNLRQGPIAAQQDFEFLRDKTPLLAGLAAAIFVSFGFSIFAEMRALDAEQATLEAQLEATTKAQLGEGTRDVAKATQMLEDAISGKSGDPAPEIDAFDVLVELSERLPPLEKLPHDIAEFDYNRGVVKIQGVVPTIDDAHAIAAAMGQHPCFQNVNIARTTRLKQEDKQKYSLEMTVKCGPKEKKPAKGGAPAKGKAKDTGSEGDEP